MLVYSQNKLDAGYWKAQNSWMCRIFFRLYDRWSKEIIQEHFEISNEYFQSMLLVYNLWKCKEANVIHRRLRIH